MDADRSEAIHRNSRVEQPSRDLRDAENELDHIVATIKAHAKEFVMKPFDAHILIGKLDGAARPTGDRT